MGQRRRSRRFLRAAGLLLCTSTANSHAQGADAACSAEEAPREDKTRVQVKAAMIVSFLRYCKWPKASTVDRELRIAVLGEWEEEAVLTGSVAKLASKERPVRLEFLDLRKVPEEERAARLADYHSVVIGELDQELVAQVLNWCARLPVLTIMEERRAVRPRSIIELYLVKGRYRMRVCNELAKHSGLVLDAQLLRLAEIVEVERSP